MYREIDRLPNFKFSKRMCTSLISQSWLGNEICFTRPSSVTKYMDLSSRRCQSLGTLNGKEETKADCRGNNLGHKISQERLMSFSAESSFNSALDSENFTDQFTNVECVHPGGESNPYQIAQASETSYENLSDKVLMPYSLQKIFVNPSMAFKSDSHSSPESINVSYESYLHFTPTVIDDKHRSTQKNVLYKHLSASPKLNISPSNSSNVSTVSSSCSFPSLLDMLERRHSSLSDTERSQTSLHAQRERRLSDSNGNSSFVIAPSSTETNSPRENWYYYDLRMRPGQPFQVDHITDTLLEFFQQLNGPARPTPPPSYDTTIGMDVSSTTSSSILIPVESVADMFPEVDFDSLPATPSDVCYNGSPPPYSEYDEPPAYEEIGEHDYQNIYEIIDNLDGDATTDSHRDVYTRPTNLSDFISEPQFGPESRSGFGFGLAGRPAVRWNVESGVDRWARAPSLGWNQI